MGKSLRDTYAKEYTDKIAKMFDTINQLQDENHKIRVEYEGSNKSHEIIIKFKYSSEIMRYFQFVNGSIGYDMFVIKYLLHSLLLYIYIAQEKQLDEAQQATCSLEIEKDFYFFLNCIYNFKEKYEKFFRIKKNKLDLNESVLSQEGKNIVLELNDKFYNLTKDYCLARNHIVHDIYTLKYDISTNTIFVSYSIFDLSNDRLINKKSNSVFSI